MTTTTTTKQTEAAKPQVMYMIEREVDGEVFSSQVSILGVPMWLPQKDETHPKALAGEVIDIVVLPPNEELGSLARDAIVLKDRKGSHWKCPVNVVLERQFQEMHRPKNGEKILLEFEGKAKKGKGSKQPSNLFRISFLNPEKTAAAAKAAAAAPGTAQAPRQAVQAS